DPEAQLLEDAACLVFLEHHFAPLAERHGHDKMVSIVAKTWRKMSSSARVLAAELPLAPRERAIVAAALTAPAPIADEDAPRRRANGCSVWPRCCSVRAAGRARATICRSTTCARRPVPA